MNDLHIISRLDAGPLGQLTAAELDQINAHVGGCEPCRRAYAVARFTDELLGDRIAAFAGPPPFFSTRVLAAWRERIAVDSWSIARLWRNAGALVSSMAATVVVLLALTLVLPAPPAVNTDHAVAQVTTYSAEDVIIGNDAGANSSVSPGQAATTILDGDDDGQ